MIVLAALLGGAYAVGVRRVAHAGRSWPVTRSLAAAGAVAAMVGASAVGDRTFTGHMVEHVLVGMAAPLLLALAAPLTLALQTGSPGLRAGLRSALRSRPVAVIGHPLVGFALFAATTVALYLTPLLELTARSGPVHLLVHAHLLTVGCLFAWPLVDADASPRRLPAGARLLVVLLTVPVHAFLGVVLLGASVPSAPEAYPDLADQHRAAAVLWGAGELMTVVLAAVVWKAWLAADRREAARFDRRLEAHAPHAETGTS